MSDEPKRGSEIFVSQPLKYCAAGDAPPQTLARGIANRVLAQLERADRRVPKRRQLAGGLISLISIPPIQRAAGDSSDAKRTLAPEKTTKANTSTAAATISEPAATTGSIAV
jgi:hypothetical protein